MTEKLQEFRDAIDAIDDQLIALLRDRCDIVSQVGEYKREQGEVGAFIRSGREGAMHRRIYQTFAGSPFHPGAAVAIWRQIIAASTAIETKLTLHTLGSPADAAAWHARIYFGRFHPLVTHDESDTLLKAVAKDGQALAILPMPTADHNSRWWIELAQLENAPKVFAHIPYVHVDPALPPMLAAGYLTPEPSGHDMTLLALHLDGQHDADSVVTQLHEATMLDSVADGKTRQVCLSIPGFVTEEDEVIRALRTHPAILDIRCLGQYPEPITPI